MTGREIVQAPSGMLQRLWGEAQDVWGDADRLAHGRRRSGGEALPRKLEVSWSWYVGLGTMGALGVVEWPVAALLAAAHAIERHSRNQIVDQFAEGIDAGG